MKTSNTKIELTLEQASKMASNHMRSIRSDKTIDLLAVSIKEITNGPLRAVFNVVLKVCDDIWITCAITIRNSGESYIRINDLMHQTKDQAKLACSFSCN